MCTGVCSAEQVVAIHNQALSMAKSGKIDTILEMDWPSSDEDDGDFKGSGNDSDADGEAADEEPRKKSRRVRMPSPSAGHRCFC